MNTHQLLYALVLHENDLKKRMDAAAAEAEANRDKHPRKYAQGVKLFQDLQARYSAICEWRRELETASKSPELLEVEAKARAYKVYRDNGGQFGIRQWVNEVWPTVVKD